MEAHVSDELYIRFRDLLLTRAGLHYPERKRGDLLHGLTMASQAAGDLKQAEQTSFDGLMGKANTREVVDAVMQAEQSLQTAIAFRDKIVNAYLEITKMQI